MCSRRPKAPAPPQPLPPPQPLRQPDAFAARLSATNRLPAGGGRGVPQSTLLTPVNQQGSLLTGTPTLGGS